MGIASRVDRLQRRYPALGFPVAVAYKFVDDFGGFLAALLTYYAFISLFPLLLLFTTILGWVLVGHAQLQADIQTSVFQQIPVIGDQLSTPKAIGGGVPGLVIGLLGSLYGGLGVGQAAQYAMNTAWAVPRNERPNPLKARGRGLLLLLTAGVALLGTTALSTLAASSAGSLGSALKTLALIGAVMVNTLVFLFVFRIAVARPLSFAQVAPGAITAALAWQVLQTLGVTYASRVIARSSATNAVFAVVLGLLAFLYVSTVAVVFCIEINVVRVKRLYPRALLTPFTDDVMLTGGDERTYTDQAEAQRVKGFQDIDVTFNPPEEK